MSNECQLLVVITTRTPPFSVSTQVISFNYKQNAELAKEKIDRQLNGLGGEVYAEVVLMEGSSD